MSKVFTGIINAHVMNYCELRDLPFDEQCGFRKNRSRVDQLYTLTSLVRNRRSENKGTYACFIDWVDMFFYKLQEYNIDGKVYNCIKELYNHPLSNVKLNNYVTDWFSTESGVRQGDSLSPTLFAICINDLAKELKELDIPISIPFAKNKIPFADDIVILAENKSQLQKLLDFLNTWCNNWKMIKLKLYISGKNRYLELNKTLILMKITLRL